MGTPLPITARRDDQSTSGRVTAEGTDRPSSLRSMRGPAQLMVFTKRLREGIRRGRIRSSIRIWTRPHVKVGGRYRMDEGHIVVDSIVPMAVTDITYDLARESGFDYLPPGAWDTPK